jgi:hypothetical protein
MGGGPGGRDCSPVLRRIAEGVGQCDQRSQGIGRRAAEIRRVVEIARQAPKRGKQRHYDQGEPLEFALAILEIWVHSPITPETKSIHYNGLTYYPREAVSGRRSTTPTGRSSGR